MFWRTSVFTTPRSATDDYFYILHEYYYKTSFILYFFLHMLSKYRCKIFLGKVVRDRIFKKSPMGTLNARWKRFCKKVIQIVNIVDIYPESYLYKKFFTNLHQRLFLHWMPYNPITQIIIQKYWFGKNWPLEQKFFNFWHHYHNCGYSFKNIINMINFRGFCHFKHLLNEKILWECCLKNFIECISETFNPDRVPTGHGIFQEKY